MNNSNNSTDEVVECPLCMEPLEVDDLNFFPCTCGYQICRFCWHRIRTDENELCPACRKEYPENPADFKPLTQEEMIVFKSQKRQRVQQRKQKITESRKHLANVRVVQKNLVFVVGLPPRLADSDILKKHEYFGKYGKIFKVVINPSTTYAGVQGPSASAYVTYVHNSDALRAIQSVNNIMIDGRLIKSSLGTTKYCSHFMKNQQCPKGDCMYLHELGDPEASFTKEEMHQGKHQEYEKRLHDVFVAPTSTSTSGCTVSTGGINSLNSNGKNSENNKVTTLTSSSTTSTNTSATLICATKSSSSSLVGVAPQKEAWPSLSIYPVNQKYSMPSTEFSCNKNKKERVKHEKNKSEKNTKTKNKSILNINNTSSISSSKDVNFPIAVSTKTENENCLIEYTIKSKSEKNKEEGQTNILNRSNPKKDLIASIILEHEIKENSNNKSLALGIFVSNSNEICSSKINDNNITKIDNLTSFSSSNNSNNSCFITKNDTPSVINESASGKSTPGNFNDNSLIGDYPKLSLKCQRSIKSITKMDTIGDHYTKKSSLLESCPKPLGYKEKLFANNNYTNQKTCRQNLNNNIETIFYVNETANGGLNKDNESLSEENKTNDVLADTISKLNIFEENSFLSSAEEIFQQSFLRKNKHKEDTVLNQISNITAPNLPDLINGIDGYQNTTNEWEEALQNVMRGANKQMEEKLYQQRILNQNHTKQQEDLHRLREIQKRNNPLSSIYFSQLNGTHNDFQINSNRPDLNRQTNLHNQHHFLQHSISNSNENVLQNASFETSMSKFFDFHKHQQQKLQHCLQINGDNNQFGDLDENLHMVSLLDNNNFNTQVMDQNCMLSLQQQQHQNKNGFSKFDSMPCHQTFQQPKDLSVKAHQNQFVHTDDDLGFDPFIETQKALAELIETEEETQNIGIITHPKHKSANNLPQSRPQQMIECIQRARGFSHVNNFSNYGIVQQLENNSNIIPFMNIPNNFNGSNSQRTQHQHQLQIPNNAWNIHLENYPQYDQQILSTNSNQQLNADYTGTDWTAMDPAILSFRQFSFPHHSQLQPQQEDVFLQQLEHQQTGGSLKTAFLKFT